MQNVIKEIRFHLDEGESDISIKFQDLEEAFLDIKNTIQKYPKGCMLYRNHKFLQTQFIIHKTDPFIMLVFDEKGKFISKKNYANDYFAPFSVFISELFVFLLPADTELSNAIIQSMEIVPDKYEWLYKDKYGVYSNVCDQCSESCTCEEGCRSDDLFFGTSYLYYQYRENLLNAKKKDQDYSKKTSKNNDEKKLDNDNRHITLSGLIDYYEEKPDDDEKEIKLTIENFMETSNESIKTDLQKAYKKINDDKKVLQESNTKFLELLKQERQIRKTMADQNRLTEFMKALNDETPMTEEIWSWWRNRY